jgi:hypothetical protein
MPVNNLYYNKYLKYKNKYLNLQSQIGGVYDDRPLIDRQNSAFITCQGNEPTCWAHGVTRLIMKLITTFFYTYFSLRINDCHHYYNTIYCNLQNTIFDCFLQIKKGDIDCYNSNGDHIDKDWYKENFSEEHLYALLFHFIFSTLIKQYGRSDGTYPETTSLYILDYLKYINITDELIKDTLKYNITKYDTDDISYFNKLIDRSVTLFKDIKESLNNKRFNPIIYLAGHNYIPDNGNGNLTDVTSIFKYKYYTKEFECNNNDYFLIEKEEISFTKKLLDKNMPFSGKITNLDPEFTNEYNLKKFTKTTKLQENIKYVLKRKYYALLHANKHVLTVTDCSDDVNDLYLDIKNSWGLKSCQEDDEEWCKLINDNKISMNLLLSSGIHFYIFFFYPYEYTDEQKKIIDDFERNTSTFFTSTKKISDDEGIAIAHALAQNTTLLDLNLRDCNITDYIVKEITEALEINNTLTELDLQGNNIGDDGAIALGKALKINRTLTFIDLAYNNIEDTGTLAIAEALKTNEIIKNVDLAHNKKISSGIKDHVKSLLGLGQEKRILFT